MFRSVNSLLSKKYNKFLRANNKISIIEKSFKDFLDNQFGAISQKIVYNLVYEGSKDSLIIKTESKVVANELSLRINELVRVFKEADIRLSRITIQ